VQIATPRRRRAHRLSIQRFVYCGRAILRGIDKRDLAIDHSCDRAGEQRIMRATQHKRVDPVGKQRLEVAHNHLIRDRVVEQSFFD